MRWMVLILGLFLSGCYTQYQPRYQAQQGPPPLQSTSMAQVDSMAGAQQPAAYKVGFMEGCDSGHLSAGDNSFLFKKDTERFKTDDVYKQGWNDGFNRCVSGAGVTSGNYNYQSYYNYYYPYGYDYYYPSYYYAPGYSIWSGYYGYPRYYAYGQNYYYTPWYGGHRHRGGHRSGGHRGGGHKGGGHKGGGHIGGGHKGGGHGGGGHKGGGHGGGGHKGGGHGGGGRYWIR